MAVTLRSDGEGGVVFNVGGTDYPLGPEAAEELAAKLADERAQRTGFAHWQLLASWPHRKHDEVKWR